MTTPPTRRSLPLLGTRDEPQPIDSWQFRNAGFTAKRYEEALCDPTWKLAGRPYLVLCRGDVRIPVFRQHQPMETLYRQHFARWTFIIGKDGNILYKNTRVVPAEDSKQVLEFIKNSK